MTISVGVLYPIDEWRRCLLYHMSMDSKRAILACFSAHALDDLMHEQSKIIKFNQLTEEG